MMSSDNNPRSTLRSTELVSQYTVLVYSQSISIEPDTLHKVDFYGQMTSVRIIHHNKNIIIYYVPNLDWENQIPAAKKNITGLMGK